MSSKSKPKARSPEEIVLDWYKLLPNEKGTLSILDTDVDGFHEGHFKTEDIVGIIVVLPDSSKRDTDEEAISRLMQALKTILEMCLGDLSHVEKKKVVLYLTNRVRYFGKVQRRDLTPLLTALMNSRSIKKDTSLEYTGTNNGIRQLFF
jgi:hypothetical protein